MFPIKSISASILLISLVMPRPVEDVKLEGTYTVVSGEKGGKPVPEDHIKGSWVKITDKTISGTDKDRKEFFASTYTLDTKTNPMTIYMKATTPKESDAPGLLKKEGDTITIIYSLPGAPAPTEFKTKDNQHMFVLKPKADK